MQGKKQHINNHFLAAGRRAFGQRWLRRSVQPYLFIAALLTFFISFASCEKDFDIKVPANQPALIVEAYINNEDRLYNYVALSRSLDYLSLDFQSTPLTNAVVTITEGEQTATGYRWDSATRVRLFAGNLPGVPASFSNIYFDPRLTTNFNNALLGRPGKSYILEITESGKYYSAITNMLQPVQIDSLTTGYGYLDEEDKKQKLRLTNHYKDPDTLNNTQLYLYRFSENRNRFGWGSFFGLRNSATGSDELTNGQYLHITNPRGFLVGDTVNYHMASVTRDVFRFWQSFNNARNNGGPFATPVTLTSNISGTNVIGCFSGMSLSSRTIIIK